MIKRFLFSVLLLGTFCPGSKADNSQLAKSVADDKRMDEVERLAFDVASKGFNAGSGYREVWIRDFNTFIELSMEVMPDSTIRKNLNMFYACQEDDGNIPDGFLEMDKADPENDPDYKACKEAPGFVYYKNTVETDQESSLVQAVAKYIRKSGNKAYLKEEHYGSTVYDHLTKAMEYLLSKKMDGKYGLIIGATTADWGDVQPEHGWGVDINVNSHYCIDIYDNAMFILALNDMAEMASDNAGKARWADLSKTIAGRIRNVLWDEKNQKFHPHVYLADSPFPKDFDEERICFHGGTAVAILAGILNAEEVDNSLKRMLDDQKKAHAQTIGITLYPVYPSGYFQNRIMYPYGYQNGGDWTWFGARMVNALVKYSRLQEAYDILQPMLQRVCDNQAFYEWYTPAGEPEGSGTFRGEAGVLYSAIETLRQALK